MLGYQTRVDKRKCLEKYQNDNHSRYLMRLDLESFLVKISTLALLLCSQRSLVMSCVHGRI